NFVTRDFLSELLILFKAKRTFAYVNTLWLLIILHRKGTLRTKQMVKDNVNSQIEYIQILKDEANLKSMKDLDKNKASLNATILLKELNL
ncbi:MAG: hypothetical protein EZS28_048358, partial [Streblomastix strix]